LGFCLIALSAVSFLANAFDSLPSASGRPIGVLIFILLGALAVGTYWSVWWYKKRDYFVANLGAKKLLP
jgi:hypothetical protein